MSTITGSSLRRLSTCDEAIQGIIHEASVIMDMSVTCGVRSQEDQDKAFSEGKSKLRWPDSKHNLKPGQEKSKAVDVIPYFLTGKDHYDWEDELAFARLAGVIMAVAHRRRVALRWGGDWDRDGRSADERFLDLPHFELDED